jgi:hypothetical protein
MRQISMRVFVNIFSEAVNNNEAKNKPRRVNLTKLNLYKILWQNFNR